MLDIGTGTPDFINEKGVKWWLNKYSTEYARKPDIHGTRLKTITCYYTEEPDGNKGYVLVDEKKGIPVWHGSTFEGVGVWIDMMKFKRRKK